MTTMHGNMPKKIRPKTLENRIRYVLDRVGVEREQADKVWFMLTTGLDPMPEGVPESFTYRRVEITWPQGVATRMLHKDERKTLNLALEADHVHKVNWLDDECNATEGRLVYETLWRKTQRADYEDPTTAQAQFDALVAESEFDLRLHAPKCEAVSPSDKVCLLDLDHEGKHKNGRTTWGTKVTPTPDEPTPAPEPIGESVSLDDRLASLVELTRTFTNA